MVLKVDHCCFCADLRLGSLIFGYIHLMKDIIQILISTIILAVHVSSSSYHRNESVIAFSATFLTFGLITLMFTILLLNGLNQYKRGFVLAFLIYSGISTVIYSITCLVLICISEIFVLFVPGLLFLVLYLYFLLVIRSYYAKMDDSATKSAIFSTPAGPFVEQRNYGVDPNHPSNFNPNYPNVPTCPVEEPTRPQYFK